MSSLFVLLLGNAVAAPLSEKDAENLACLRAAYPEISGIEASLDGRELWLTLSTGTRILYARAPATAATTDSSATLESPTALDVTVQESMEMPYRLEPVRPSTPPGYAPGRKRSYALLRALYGNTRAEVTKNLVTVTALGQKWRLSPKAARAFAAVADKLESVLRDKPELRPWLVNDGTFVWRNIAGETVQSPHAFGIAIDIGVDRGATYWRWSRLNPHPLQATYALEIVAAFEEAGFIWGGKWHEYDLMHFEYRPELICLSRKRASDRDAPAAIQPIDQP